MERTSGIQTLTPTRRFSPKNDCSTTQLNVMGYRGDVLRVQFHPDKISEMKALGLVTVANTCEHQEALAPAHPHGKKFFATGGEHMTSDNMFIAVELNRRRAEAMEREKNKKSWVEYHPRREAALPIVDRLENELENNAGWLKSKELEVLLRWKGVPVLTMGNVANQRILYQKFTEGGAEEAGILASWMEINKAELIPLRDAPIAMCDNAYGQFEEQKKRDVEQAYQKMSTTEKEVFKQKMAEINEGDIDDGETPPPTPTPI
jgi:hypothetical protein